jgi:hypothetical protein
MALCLDCMREGRTDHWRSRLASVPGLLGESARALTQAEEGAGHAGDVDDQGGSATGRSAQ